jgi:PAS domain S-box-containing protein
LKNVNLLKSFSDYLPKRIIFYSSLGILFVGLIVAAVSIIPFHHNLINGQEQHLFFAAKSKTQAIEEKLSHFHEIAAQISNRTMIRQKLEAYNRGELPLLTFKPLIEKALTDSLLNATLLAGICLYDRNGTPLAKVGLPLPNDLRPSPGLSKNEITFQGIVLINGENYLLIHAPIVELSEGLSLGSELILFKLDPLKKIVEDKSGLGDTGIVLLVVNELRENGFILPNKGDQKGRAPAIPAGSLLREAVKKAFNKENGVLSPTFFSPSQEVIAYGPIQPLNWGLIVKMDKQELYAPIRNQIWLLTTLILILIVAGCLGMIFLLRPLAGKIIIHTDELEKQIQEKTLTLQKELLERQEAVEAADRERKRLFDLLDGLPASVYLQAPDYSIRNANRYFREHFGNPEGKLCYQIFQGLEQPCLNCPTFKVFETKTPQIWKMNRLGGRTYQIYNYFYTDADGSPFVLELGIDISDLKKKEQELKESRNLLDKILSNLDEAVLVTDAQRVICDCNKTTEEMFGYSREELIGRNIEMLHPKKESYDQFGQEALNNYNLQGFHKVEYLLKRKNGELFPVVIMTKPLIDESGQYEKIVGSVRDITERKKNEAELNRLAASVNQATESILITDGLGRVEYVNPAFEVISGYEKEEIIHWDMDSFVEEKDFKILEAAISLAFNKGMIWKGNLTKIKKDGSSYEVEASLSPIRDAQGMIINLVAVERDVTHEIQLERQIRQTQKMEAIGTLAGGIAHDFNNILTAIMGYTEICLFKEKESTKIRHDLEQVLKAGLRAKDLVNQILTFSRQSDQEKKPLQPEILIKEGIKLLRASLPSTIEIRQNIESVQGRILADPTQIHQVVMNLCTNAAQAMNEGGGILDISLEEISHVPSQEDDPLNLRPGNYLKLSVSDTGVGIDPTVKDRIFDPFFTTKELGKGTGLGLSTVYGIIKNLGGDITVDSTPGEGSRFDVFFPKISGTEEESPQRSALFSHGKERILLIDDEESIVDMGQQMLEQLGYKVTIRTSSKEALELFKIKSSEFDLVITDMTMPHLTGIKLTEHFLAIRPDIPIILCTGFSLGLSLEQIKAIGIRDVIMKPLIRAELARTIRNVLDANQPMAGGKEKRNPEREKIPVQQAETRSEEKLQLN